MPKDADATAFIGKLRDATQRVAAEHFVVPYDSGNGIKRVYRERAYCYELYHQLRNSWGAFPYTLNGELSKARHPRFRNLRLEKSPDLLAHRPGTSTDNLVIVEVKNVAGLSWQAVRKDLETLWRFVSAPVSYERGVLLVYGDEDGRNAVSTVQRFARRWLSEGGDRQLAKLRLLRHVAAGRPVVEENWTEGAT